MWYCLGATHEAGSVENQAKCPVVVVFEDQDDRPSEDRIKKSGAGHQ